MEVETWSQEGELEAVVDKDMMVTCTTESRNV